MGVVGIGRIAEMPGYCNGVGYNRSYYESDISIMRPVCLNSLHIRVDGPASSHVFRREYSVVGTDVSARPWKSPCLFRGTLRSGGSYGIESFSEIFSLFGIFLRREAAV